MNIIKKDNKLKADVKNFIENKIFNIKCVDEIPISLFQMDEKYPINNINDLYNELYILKKVLQLTINVYNNKVKYKDFVFKFSTNNNDLLEKLNLYFIHDTVKELWKYKTEPSQSHVEEALYDYIFCHLSITLNSPKNDVNEDEIKIDECSFCSEKIKPKGDCDACDSSYKDILEYVIKSGSMNRFKGNTNKINNQEDNQDAVEVNEEVNSKIEKEFEEEPVNKLLRKLDEDKAWSCTACTMKNSFNNDQCEVCGMKNVHSIKRNTCGDCGTVKNLDNKDCNVCTKKTIDSEVKIEKDRWKCGKCGKVHLYSTIVCDGCCGSRMVNGLWMCSECTLINKWRNSKCEVCDAPNIPSLEKNTDNIQKNRGASREFNYSDKSDNLNIKNKWVCMFSNCNEWNMANNQYCGKCKVWRHASRVRGDPVKTLCNGREISVWICNKCSKHNELEKLVCECKESRYKKRFCKGCNIYNDGLSIKCEKCNQ